MALSVGVDMNILSLTKDSQCLTDGVVSWCRHEHTFTYKRPSMSDRWRLVGVDMNILSPIKDSQCLTDGVVSWRRHEHTFTYKRLSISDR
jgi:hypothetical protein